MTTELALRPSKRLEAGRRPIWRAILDHPYLKQLAAGTLPRAAFREYVKQDWLYLQEFLRASTVIASRCPDPELMKVLLQRVQWLITMEHHFHHKHAAELELDFERLNWEMNEANYAYTRHMLWAAHTGSTLEALGAMMPCPCVYIHVGASPDRRPAPGRPDLRRVDRVLRPRPAGRAHPPARADLRRPRRRRRRGRAAPRAAELRHLLPLRVAVLGRGLESPRTERLVRLIDRSRPRRPGGRPTSAPIARIV